MIHLVMTIYEGDRFHYLGVTVGKNALLTCASNGADARIIMFLGGPYGPRCTNL